MPDSTLPEDVREFLLRHIDSVGHLEALLLLWRTREKRWNSSAMAQELYIGEPVAADILARLSSLGVISAAEGDYWFSAQQAALCADVARVADTYSQRLVAVTRLIHSKPASRIQEFADAFKLRKDK